MADFYVKSGQAVERANSTAYALGNKMVPARADTSTNNAVAKRWVWECTVAGTSGAAVPTWPASVTQDTTTVTDGTVTWRARKPGFSSGTTPNWTFAHPYLDMMLSGTAAGDRIFVSNNHNETAVITANTTWTFPGTNASPTLVYCVDDSATPPTALATGARISSSGSFNILFTGVFYLYGIEIVAGTGTNNATLNLASGDQSFVSAFNCNFILGGNNTAARVAFGATNTGIESGSYLRNCNFRFAAAGQGLEFRQHDAVFEGGSILSGGTAITTFVNASSGNDILITGFDLSNAATGVNLVAASIPSVGSCNFRYMKMPTSWSGNLAGGDPLNPQFFMSFFSTDAAGNKDNFETRSYAGRVLEESTNVRTGGSDIAWRMISTANAEFPTIPLSSPEIYFSNTTVGTPVTVSVEVLTDGVTLNNNDIWLDVLSMNTASNTIGTWTPSFNTNLLGSGTNYPTSSETWVTTGFTTPVRQTLSVTFTPQVAGDFVAQVRLCRASTTVVVDPAIVVT